MELWYLPSWNFLKAKGNCKRGGRPNDGWKEEMIKAWNQSMNCDTYRPCIVKYMHQTSSWMRPLDRMSLNNYYNHSHNLNYFRTVTHSAVLVYKGLSTYKQTNLLTNPTEWRYIEIKIQTFNLMEIQSKVKQQEQ